MSEKRLKVAKRDGYWEVLCPNYGCGWGAGSATSSSIPWLMDCARDHVTRHWWDSAIHELERRAPKPTPRRFWRWFVGGTS